MTVGRMHISCRKPKFTDTHSEYVTLIFFPATMVTRSDLSVTLYVHCLAFYLIWRYI